MGYTYWPSGINTDLAIHVTVAKHGTSNRIFKRPEFAKRQIGSLEEHSR
jgi:hypothetical protein